MTAAAKICIDLLDAAKGAGRVRGWWAQSEEYAARRDSGELLHHGGWRHWHSSARRAVCLTSQRARFAIAKRHFRVGVYSSSSIPSTVWQMWRLQGFVLGLCLAVSQAIPRDRLYPFGSAQGDSRLQTGDDISSEEIKLQIPVVFYEKTFWSLYVSTGRCDECFMAVVFSSSHALQLQVCDPKPQNQQGM